MKTWRMLKHAGGALAAGGAIAAGGYAALVVLNRATYGKASRSADTAKDSVLDGFIPNPEVKEHHQIKIHAACRCGDGGREIARVVNVPGDSRHLPRQGTGPRR